MAIPELTTGVEDVRQELRVLLVEDSHSDAELNELELRRNGFQIESTRVEARDETLRALRDEEWDLVLSHHALPGFSAHEGLELLHELRLDMPRSIVSGAIGADARVEPRPGGRAASAS